MSIRSNHDESWLNHPTYYGPSDGSRDALTRVLGELVGQGNLRWRGAVWAFADFIRQRVPGVAHVDAAALLRMAMTAPGFRISQHVEILIEIERM